MNPICSKVLVLFLISLSYSTIFGQTAQPLDSLGDRPEFRAFNLSQDPVVDGEIINDPIWQMVPAIDNLIQLRPNYGQPVSEKTVIRVAYSKSTFYVAVVCHDSEPEKIVV